MHKTIAEATVFFHTLKEEFPKKSEALVWIAPPFTAIHSCATLVKELGLSIAIGGQTMHQATQGAFTGEISGAMLQEAGASFCLLGHSERRELFHETDATVNAKVRRALELNLIPVLCIGEKDSQRANGEYMHVVEQQLAAGLTGVESRFFKHLVIAYEPIWAIGTGNIATPEIAQEMHQGIRSFVAKRWGNSIAKQLPIIYGGSVKSDHIDALLKQPDIDGVLIGGAALDPKHFAEIINKASKS